MNSNLNPGCACHNPGCLRATHGPQAEYCSLRCRDAAKRKRRLRRESQGVAAQERVEPTLLYFGPASPDTLASVAAALLDGTMESPIWFTGAFPWTAPAGLLWEVLADGTGKLSLK